MHPLNPDVARAFVLCPNYHGATLLATLLGRHPDVVHLGDTNPPRRDHEACGCGLPIGDCPFWKGLRTYLQLDGDHPVVKRWLPRFPVFTGHYRLDRMTTLGFAAANRVVGRPLDTAVSEAARDFRRMQAGLADYAADRANARLFVDGEKALAKALLLSTDDRSNSRIIHLVRDPRGFAWSSLSRGRGSPETLGRDWRRSHDVLRRSLRLLGTDSVLTVRYEDLAGDPGASTKQILHFLGIDRASDRATEENQHVIGNRMIIDFDGAIRLDEKWRTGLGDADAARILDDAGSFARKLGYR